MNERGIKIKFRTPPDIEVVETLGGYDLGQLVGWEEGRAGYEMVIEVAALVAAMNEGGE